MSVASLSRYLIQDTWNNKSTLHLKPSTWNLLPGATISRLRGSKTGALGRRMVEMSVASPPPRLRSHDRRIGQHTDGIAHNSDGIAHSTDGIVHKIIVRIPHLRIPHWGAILRWGILSQSVIRITHPNYYVFYALFVHDMGPG